ncbi:transposase [Desulfonema ishimotonii]|uniref:Transposase n=1 Tax=Desulfonema ishimotonii TaxID=45657 RepID=A0A401FTY5_9BACT|nr:RNA-guided endonuclease TnpB family protein [Desulfonema ishimotonii]GBC60408.1 transposase [Desulfonema ishimotonii]
MDFVIRRSYKYRIYPAKAQISNLENQFSMCRHLYNRSLAERTDAYEKDGTTISYNQQQNSLPELKKKRPWYKGVYSQVLQDVLRRLDKAYQAFFRRVRTGGKPGFPKFRKRGQWNSITYPQYRKRPDPVITVPKIGRVRLVCHRELPDNARVKTLTITREAGKWFACFPAELPFTAEPEQDLTDPLGIDLGLIDFFYASDGSHVPVPKHLRKKEKQLRRLQRRLAKAEKRSEKYYKILKAVRKCHYRIKCRRSDFLHKTASDLLKKSGLIFYEDLRIANMIRRPRPKQDEDGKYLPNNASAKAGLNKSLADAGWGRFIEILKYKSRRLGKKTLAVPPQYTSQKCSACGEIVKKSLSVRTHRCACGFVVNRDLNAALNILRIGMDTLQAPT